jgi:hypothetical protein
MFVRPDGKPGPGAFRNQQDPNDPAAEPGMSTYWSEHATAQQVQDAGRIPADNLVVEMNAGRVRRIPLQRVVYTPNDQPVIGQAHTDVFGPKDKDPEVRKMFFNITTVVLPFNQPA